MGDKFDVQVLRRQALLTANAYSPIGAGAGSFYDGSSGSAGARFGVRGGLQDPKLQCLTLRPNPFVTQVELHLNEGEYIVSKTDLKGRITYVNRPFMEISGYSADELLGHPHNVIRHPDMPSEAFEDLWRTLRSGKAWRGMVKNRCKNGDHYWVDANANPIWEGGRWSATCPCAPNPPGPR